MEKIASYVFLDLETSSIPSEDYNKTRITEISMVAVKRSHILDTPAGETPRVQHKLTLCVRPCRMIQPEATTVTGLCNELLEYETFFSTDVCNLIKTFLGLLTKPVCLLAHNGMYFDFPILKNHLEKLNVSLCSTLMCADTYHGFYDILNHGGKKKDDEEPTGSAILVPADSSRASEINNPISVCESSIGAKTEDSETDYLKGLDHSDFCTSNLSMQKINETTPRKKTKWSSLKVTQKKKISNTLRRFPWPINSKPKDSYKLKDIYERIFDKTAAGAHRAENDCVFTLKIAVALGKSFVKWVDEHCEPFSTINAMKPGVPLGY